MHVTHCTLRALLQLRAVGAQAAAACVAVCVAMCVAVRFAAAVLIGSQKK